MEKKEPTYTADENVNCYSYYGRLKIELPYDPSIPLLGLYPEKTRTQKDIYALMLIATLFTTART